MGGGGGAVPAIVAAVLLNACFLAMGIAVAPYLKGGPLRRALEGQAVDASWGAASRWWALRQGVHDRGYRPADGLVDRRHCRRRDGRGRCGERGALGLDVISLPSTSPCSWRNYALADGRPLRR